jgi:hypothetical protein
MNPGFEPAKIHSKERINATREKTSGRAGRKRILNGIWDCLYCVGEEASKLRIC